LNLEQIDKDIAKHVRDRLSSEKIYSGLDVGLRETVCVEVVNRTQELLVIVSLQYAYVRDP
jgi:hypothetical protein